MIPLPDGSYEKHGMDEVKVYRPDETSVIKFRRLDADTSWYLEIMAVNHQNLIPDFATLPKKKQK